jgi:hypothetical protein
VINLSSDDMLLPVSVELSDTFERQVVAFGSSRGKNDFFALCTDDFSYV